MSDSRGRGTDKALHMNGHYFAATRAYGSGATKTWCSDSIQAKSGAAVPPRLFYVH